MLRLLVALSTFACSLLVSVIFTLASPVSVINGELVNIKNSQHIGKGTLYYPGLGKCGCTNTSADFVLAISKGLLYDSNEGSNCYQWVHIVDVNNGKQAYGLTVDMCKSCGFHDIDMSPALFKKLASPKLSEITVAWNFTSNPSEIRI